ncbi:MAG: glycosyltransferase [Lachnospiraceae bacterium]|nr:glycosyltransferase [Lachnospiraceae bacterium]
MGINDRLNKLNMKRVASYLKRNGLRKTYYKVRERLNRDDEEKDYLIRVEEARLNEAEAERQRRKKFFHNYKFSILVPAYNTKPEFLKGMMDSVVAQTYTDWELCIADGSDTDIVQNTVKEYCALLDEETKSKIRHQRLNANRGIAGNSNGALVMAQGDYVGMLDHDDILTDNALYEIMEVLESGIERNGNIYSSKYKAFYSDEDKTDESETRYFDHHSKPDFDIDLLRSNNYICHFFVVKTQIARKAGGFRSEFNGAQDHDFIFRCIEQLEPEEIYHIPKVLYHWRSSIISTAENPDSKLYAYEAGKRAIKAHLDRLNIDAQVSDTSHLGFFRIKYLVNDPKVKIMTKDEWDYLTKESFEDIKEDYIMILGNNIKPLSKDYINELAGMLLRKEVGAVGGKILNKRGRIDSAGYMYDEDKKLKPLYRGMNGHYSGYLHRASLQHKVDGLAADCMMIKKSAVEYINKPVLSDKFLTLYDPFALFKRKV